MTHRILMFSMRKRATRVEREHADVDLLEPFEHSEEGAKEDLRAFLAFHKSEGWSAYVYKRCGDEHSMEPVRVFPPNTPMEDMTQWLWMQVAVFNEDTGALDEGHVRGEADD